MVAEEDRPIPKSYRTAPLAGKCDQLPALFPGDAVGLAHSVPDSDSECAGSTESGRRRPGLQQLQHLASAHEVGWRASDSE